MLYKRIKEIYGAYDFTISDFTPDAESNEYDACRFALNGFVIYYRTAKITPKKVGQFVTFWKRNEDNITAPYTLEDPFNFCVISVRDNARTGQFIFPKSILAARGILTTNGKPGKRGFRVYPPWDKVSNKQAERTQQWQCNYFIQFEEATETESVLQRFQASTF